MQSNTNFNYNLFEFNSNEDQNTNVLKLNENFLTVSNILHPCLISLDSFSSPPSNPQLNSGYIVLSGLINTQFESITNSIAFYTTNGWRFFKPTNGMRFFVLSLSGFVYFFNNAFIQEVSSNIGDYKFSAQSQNHSGFLLCNGQAVSRATYASLFAVIGTNFGAGNGSTTFNLPDVQGRVMGSVGQGLSLTNRTLGQQVGAETHTLTINQIPPHTHGGNGGDFTFIVNTGGNYAFPDGISVQGRPISGSAGGGEAHNNMQPTLFGGNWFIYSGVL
jgi:microcystin-dependent protein